MEAYRNPALSPEKRAEDLLSRMTLREKVGQLNQRLYGFHAYERRDGKLTLSREFTDEVDRYGGMGALYGLHRADPWSGRDFESGVTGVEAVQIRNAVQKYVIDHSRFGIPALLSTESPHGHQALDGYLLPVNLASGCTFSPELLEEAEKVCGAQLRSLGLDLALVSALDMLRDPRWGRSEECFGEDPYLTSQMAGAAVRGMKSQGIDVVAKHLCAQGETTGGVNASPARIGPHELREIHLPPVKACIEAGAASFMAAYNEIDGVFCHANHRLLTELLRGEYGFEGFVMSDGVAIDLLDVITGDRVASGALALNAGVDMGLWDTAFGRLEEAVQAGLVEESRIDEAAKRILTLKFRRGLFEHPYVPETAQVFSYEDYPQSARLAEQSMVLLKNRDGLLPLSADKPVRIGLTGPNADAIYHQLGDYTPAQRPGVGTTPRQGLERLLSGTAATLCYHPGCPLFEDDPAMEEQAVAAMADTDVVIAVLGGSSSRFTHCEFESNGAAKHQQTITMDCGEGIDDGILRLPGGQLRLLRHLRALGKPIVTVLIAGRPYEMAEVEELSDAIFCCFYPGPTGGQAVARLLFGQAEPAGRLCVSLPDHASQLPVYYNPKDCGRDSAYYNVSAPRYGFGSGLSYTAFSYAQDGVPTAEDLTLRFRVTNTGARPGWAVPQLYLHRKQGVVTSRVRQLCGFRKLLLQPGETQTVEIPVPRESLRQYDASMKPCCPGGTVEWFLCDGGDTHLQGAFTLPHHR